MKTKLKSNLLFLATLALWFYMPHVSDASRNATGTYSLPNSNPVSTGSPINATWANETLSDIKTEITDSLSRSNKGAMLDNLELVASDTSPSTPGLSWDGDEDTGLYNPSANKIGISAGGVKVGEISSTTTSLPGLFMAGGRLTLTTATPVTTSDVSSATTVYYTPYLHNLITLWDGTTWVTHTFSELSQATTDATKSPAAAASGNLYDMFVWNDSGTLRCTRGPAWSSGTARGSGAGTTELTRLNGRWVNNVAITNGPVATTVLYVGTIRASTGDAIYDTVTDRYVWNMFNRVRRNLVVTDTTNTWGYGTTTWRQARATSTNEVRYIAGLNEEVFYASVHSACSEGAGGTGSYGAVNIGYDSTSSPSANLSIRCFIANTSPATTTTSAYINGGAVGLGYHSLVWLEWASATLNFWGDGGLTAGVMQGGLLAHMNM